MPRKVKPSPMIPGTIQGLSLGASVAPEQFVDDFTGEVLAIPTVIPQPKGKLMTIGDIKRERIAQAQRRLTLQYQVVLNALAPKPPSKPFKRRF